MLRTPADKISPGVRGCRDQEAARAVDLPAVRGRRTVGQRHDFTGGGRDGCGKRDAAEQCLRSAASASTSIRFWQSRRKFQEIPTWRPLIRLI